MFHGHLNFFCELWVFSIFLLGCQCSKSYYLQGPLMLLLFFQTRKDQRFCRPLECLLKCMGIIVATLTKQETTIEETATKISQEPQIGSPELEFLMDTLPRIWMYCLQTHGKFGTIHYCHTAYSYGELIIHIRKRTPCSKTRVCSSAGKS